MGGRSDVDSVRFAGAARAINGAAQALGLVAPGFVSPPRLAGVDRSLRRRPGAAPPAVAVRRRGRPESVVVADMVEGVIVANGLTGAAAEHARSRLLAAVDAVIGDGGREAA